MLDFRKLIYLRKLRKNVWLTTNQLLHIQEKKLRAIVRHAYDNVDFYHKKFKSLGLRPDDIKSAQDLTKISVTTKEDIRENFPDRITARNVDLRKCENYTTSGSTGIPLKVLVDPKGGDYRAALFGRAFFECGLRLRDKMMFVGDLRHFHGKEDYWFQKLGILQRRYFPAAKSVEEQLDEIIKYNPDAIFAYSSFLFLLARAIQKKGSNQLCPRLIFPTAEVLADDERKLISDAFGAEIFDLYGCVETERLAWECQRHAGYHMDMDSTIIEFVKENEPVPPGEEGRMILTCLYNYAMPLIRYDIGDIGVPTDEKCSCGRGLPLMKKIIGRKDDLIVRPDGRLIYSIPIRHAIRSIPGIAQYKVIQQTKTELTIYVVKDEKFSKKTTEQIINEVRRVVGEGITISPVLVEEIEKEKSGKLRAVVSNVKRPEI